MKDILRMIAEADIVLATGHLSKQETNLLLDAAVGVGVKRIMINHPEHLLYATIDEMKDYAKSGFYLEHSITLVHSYKSSYEYIYEMIREAGVGQSLMGSDLGQVNRPHPVEGIRLWAAAMLELGLSEEEIRTVLCKNPAELMGL
jgi:imidazolonepropionase-like amidohydrolase